MRHRLALLFASSAMNLNDWTESGVDATRLKRLGVGYVVGAAAIAGLFTFFTLSAAGQTEEEDEPIDVALAELPEREQAHEEPEPEPEPEPIEAEPSAPVARPGPKALETPTEVPDDKPEEVDADASSLGGGSADPYAGAKQYGDGSSGRVSSAPKAAPPPPPAAPPPKPVRRKVQRLTRDMTPPSPLTQSAPSYPSAAKDSGIEGTVVVRYVIQEDGSVSNVRAVRGPSELRAVCVAAVQRWRFTPAMLDGRAVSVSRTASFPFRIKT